MLTSSVVTLLPSFATDAAHATRVLDLLLVDWTARGAAVLVIAWAATAVLRRRAAATRHAVWTAALMAIALLPFVGRLTVVMPAPVSLLTPAQPSRPLAAPLRAPAPTDGTANSRGTRGGLAPSGGTAARTNAVSSMRTRSGVADPATLIALGWLIGVIGLVLRFATGTITVWRRALRAMVVDDPEWVMLAHGIARELRIRRPVTLLMTSARTIPVTWGIIYPVVLLPSDALEWPTGRRRSVLVHELAHVARFDAATQVLGQLVLAANWFNPLVWLAMSRMRVERERACDDAVLARGVRASAYAADLLSLARTLSGHGEPAFASLAMAQHGELEGRLRFILDARRRHGSLDSHTTTLSFVTATPAFLLLAALRPMAPSAKPVTRLPATLSLPGLRASGGLTKSAATLQKLPVRTAVLRPRVTVGAGSITTHSTRCPVEADFIHGGVSAERGRFAALEAEKDDHHILVVASDGRCETAEIDGTVVLSDDAGQVTQMGAGAHVTVTDEHDGHTRRGEIDLTADSEAAGARTGNDRTGYANQVLYVIDGVPVESPDGDPGYYVQGARPEPRKLWIVAQDDAQHSDAANANVAFHYVVDGQPRPWTEAREWFHTTLAEVVRETAYDAKGQVAHLRGQGGVGAVLEAIRHVRSDMGQREYFEALLGSGQMSRDEAEHAADLAQTLMSPSTDRDRIVSQLRGEYKEGETHHF